MSWRYVSIYLYTSKSWHSFSQVNSFWIILIFSCLLLFPKISTVPSAVALPLWSFPSESASHRQLLAETGTVFGLQKGFQASQTHSLKTPSSNKRRGGLWGLVLFLTPNSRILQLRPGHQSHQSPVSSFAPTLTSEMLSRLPQNLHAGKVGNKGWLIW